MRWTNEKSDGSMKGRTTSIGEEEQRKGKVAAVGMWKAEKDEYAWKKG